MRDAESLLRSVEAPNDFDRSPDCATVLPMERGKQADANLDPFRHGIAVLRDRNEAVGYVAAVVEPMWSPFLPFRRQEQVWLLVSWNDGSRERIFEDYAPWTAVEELRHGHFLWESAQSEIDLEATWLTGEDRERAWARYGILDDVGAYLASP
jgi:hypothetical protein